MPFRASPRNVLLGLPSTSFFNSLGTALGAAAGYSAADLCDGLMGQAWRSAAPSLNHQIIIRLPSAANDIGVLAALDVESPTPGATVTGITFLTNTDASETPPVTPYTVAGACDPSARKDGFVLATPGPVRWIKLNIGLSIAGVLDVGEIWAGPVTAFTRGYSTRQDTSEHRTVVNEDRAVAVGEERMRLALGWQTMREADHAELLAFKRLVGGARDQVLLLPDLGGAPECFLGRLSDQHAAAANYPTRQGLNWAFTEARRAIG